MNPATPHASQTNIPSSLYTPPLHQADWCKPQKVKRPPQLVHVQRLLHNGQAAHSQPWRPTYMRSNKLAKMPSCWVPLLGGQGVGADEQVTGSVQSKGHPPPPKSCLFPQISKPIQSLKKRRGHWEMITRNFFLGIGRKIFLTK